MTSTSAHDAVTAGLTRLQWVEPADPNGTATLGLIPNALDAAAERAADAILEPLAAATARVQTEADLEATEEGRAVIRARVDARRAIMAAARVLAETFMRTGVASPAPPRPRSELLELLQGAQRTFAADLDAALEALVAATSVQTSVQAEANPPAYFAVGDRVFVYGQGPGVVEAADPHEWLTVRLLEGDRRVQAGGDRAKPLPPRIGDSRTWDW